MANEVKIVKRGMVQETRIGLAMRATSENLPAAQTLGIPTRMVLG